MSELLWVKVPPPRVASGAKLTVALSLAVAIYVVPVVTVEDEDAALSVPFDASWYFACGDGHIEEPELDELVKEYGTEQVSGVFLRDPNAGNIGNVGNAGNVGYVGARSTTPIGCTVVMPPLPKRSPFTILSQGSLARRTVHRFLQRQRSSLERCADPAPMLELGGELHEDDGDPAVQFLIDRDGRVVQVMPRTSSSKIARCLEQAFLALRFPSSDGLTQVHVPLDYGTTDASAGAFVR